MMLLERWTMAVILAMAVASPAGAPGQSPVKNAPQDAQDVQDAPPAQAAPEAQQTEPPPEDAPPAPPARPADPAQQQLEKDTAELLQLVQDLKVEVDKAGSDTLSLAALRKADAIQKLAKNLKERMKERVPGTVSKP